MAAPSDDDPEDKPLDPAVERVRRKIVRFMAINLGLLFVALMAVAAAIVYQAGGGDGTAGPSALDGRIALPQGSRIVSQALSGDRLSLEVALEGGGHAIFVYDLAAARLIGRYDIEAGGE